MRLSQLSSHATAATAIRYAAALADLPNYEDGDEGLIAAGALAGGHGATAATAMAVALSDLPNYDDAHEARVAAGALGLRFGIGYPPPPKDPPPAS